MTGARASRPRVVLAQRPLPETRARLQPHAELVVNETDSAWSPRTLREKAAGAAALMAFMTERIDRELLAACSHLRIVAGALKGYDNIDIEACDERGVWVSNVPEALTAPTAELAVCLLLGVARRLHEADQHVRGGGFRGWAPILYGQGLAGSTVGLLGMGAIGQAIAQRLVGFEAELVYHDKRPLPEEHPLAGRVQRLPLERLLAESRFLVVTLPLTPETLHLIDAGTLARMRRGAFLVNPGRGSVVDEAAVLDALREGRLGGYAADVFEMEDLSRADRPRTIDPGLLAHPRTLFTPHLGSAVVAARRAIELRAAENILCALRGEPPPDAVNRPVAENQPAC